MENLAFDVDTTPMAHSVDTAHKHLKGVTVAVTAMEAAVIAAEREAARKICENVDNGFFMLVKSQISQKAVAAYTEMASKQMTLLQLVKALEGVKRQMENDYQMISRRYAKLFNSLNRALETRVKELDCPAMKLAEVRKSMLFGKLKDGSSMLFSISTEILPTTQTALSGKLKQKHGIPCGYFLIPLTKPFLTGGKSYDLTLTNIADFFCKILSGSVSIRELNNSISFDELRQRYL